MNSFESLKLIDIYTDGGCAKNPGGAGGVGIVLVQEGKVIGEIAQGYHASTNQRMEIRAALLALESIDSKHDITLYSDSKYLVNSLNSWIYGWQKRGWTRPTGPLKNADLWREIYPKLNFHKLRARWVRGHNGNVHNERCDELATYAMKDRPARIKDIGYQPEAGRKN